MEADLSRHRRFALGIALVLITYVAAGVNLDPSKGFEFAGFTFLISRPDLLPIGLILASVYSGLRFYYWGAMRSESPARQRAYLRALARDEPEDDGYLYIGHGQDKIVAMSFENAEGFAVEQNKANEIFPRVGSADVEVLFGYRWFPMSEGKSQALDILDEVQGTSTARGSWALTKVVIPRSVNFSARIEEIDYFAPFWLNVIASGLGLWSVFNVSSLVAPWLGI